MYTYIRGLLHDEIRRRVLIHAKRRKSKDPVKGRDQSTDTGGTRARRGEGTHTEHARRRREVASERTCMIVLRVGI